LTALSRNRKSFRRRRSVDVAAWAQQGEDLLDLRKTGPFKGRRPISSLVIAICRHLAISPLLVSQLQTWNPRTTHQFMITGFMEAIV
jgi:hypothetical protein